MTLFPKPARYYAELWAKRGYPTGSGDEFIILMYVNSQNEILDMIESIKHKQHCSTIKKEPYKINFSFGYSTYDSKHESVDTKKIDVLCIKTRRRFVKIIPDRRQN